MTTHMRQAITTKYLGPGNVRGSRVKATCEAGSLTLEWDNQLNAEDNHLKAAHALAAKLEWKGTWYGGAPKGSGYCFVLAGIDGVAFVVKK